MRAARFAAALVALLPALSGTALAQSEGVAEFKGTMHPGSGQSAPSTATVYFKKGVAFRSELDMSLAGVAGRESGAARGAMPSHYKMAMIQKLSDPDHIVTLNDERKTYSIMDLKKIREDANMPRSTYTVQKLGKDTVAGFSCEKALVTSSSGTQMELCISTEIFPSAAWLAAQDRGGSGNLLTALRDNGLNGFPIRWSVQSKRDQKVVATMELVRLQWKPVPASLFEIPAGYRESSAMESMMSPEQEKMMKDALEKMTPEQRKMYEEMMKKQGKKE